MCKLHMHAHFVFPKNVVVLAVPLPSVAMLKLLLPGHSMHGRVIL